MAENNCKNCMYYYYQHGHECRQGYKLNGRIAGVFPVRTPQGHSLKSLQVCSNYCRRVEGANAANSAVGNQGVPVDSEPLTLKDIISTAKFLIKAFIVLCIVMIIGVVAYTCAGGGSGAGKTAATENQVAAQPSSAVASQSANAGSGSDASSNAGSTDANTVTSFSDSGAAAAPSGAAYDRLDRSIRGSYGYPDGDAASDAAAGGHFSRFMVSNYDESAGILNIDFGWCDKGSSSPNISGDLTARYVNDGDLGDFSVFRSEGENTNANGTVKTTAELRVYPDTSEITIANMQVVATDPDGKEIYRMSIGTYDLVKQ